MSISAVQFQFLTDLPMLMDPMPQDEVAGGTEGLPRARKGSGQTYKEVVCVGERGMVQVCEICLINTDLSCFETVSSQYITYDAIELRII